MNTDTTCKILEFPKLDDSRRPSSVPMYPDRTDEEAAEFDAMVAAAVFGETADEGTTHSEKRAKRSDVALPDGIRKRIMKQYFTAAAIAFLTMLLSIGYKQPLYLVGFIISGVLIYLGLMTRVDFVEGNIEEIPVICASVNRGFLRKTTRIVFRTTDDVPTYYEFIVPGKMENEISPNYAYVIYFRARNPKELIGYTAI